MSENTCFFLKTVDKLQLGHLSQCESYSGTSQKTSSNWSHCSFIDYSLWLLSVASREEGKENSHYVVFVQNPGCVGLWWMHSSQHGRSPLPSACSLIWGTSAAGPSSFCFSGVGMLEKCFVKTKEGACCNDRADVCLRLDFCAIQHRLGSSSSSPSITPCA